MKINSNKKENNTTIVIAIDNNKLKEVSIDNNDGNKYENERSSDKFNWFHAICFCSLMIFGIFLGIIFCCLIILFA
ncbi:hypothetical protein [Mycoplasmoides alvi]|uniref:hypothetical protein n=1 Tax=Mycoplasmoides alvi TaxID=78580 RepID=UPI00051C3CC2|nr:hypothetical protein [Mycoplasmoides alvi]